ncbi:MAG: hypothetical protein QW680_11630 [Pyrobaculum sp.]
MKPPSTAALGVLKADLLRVLSGDYDTYALPNHIVAKDLNVKCLTPDVSWVN